MSDRSAESKLVSQAKEDPEAFGKLYELNVEKIYNYIYYRVGNRHDAPVLQVIRQGTVAAPVAVADGHIPDDQAGRENTAGLVVFRSGPRIADVGVSEGHQLPTVGRVGQDFLIAGHGGVENHFSHRSATGAELNTSGNAITSTSSG